MYTRRFPEKKDPQNEMNFEKKFIGKKINMVLKQLSEYDLENVGVSPVMDKNENIVGFIYDNDNDGYFKGEAIDDFGLKKFHGIWVYEM